MTSVVGFGAGHKKWMMEVYVEIVILAGSGTLQHVFAGKPVGKADRGSTNSRDTQPDTSTLGTQRSSKHTQGHQHTREIVEACVSMNLKEEENTQPKIAQISKSFSGLHFCALAVRSSYLVKPTVVQCSYWLLWIQNLPEQTKPYMTFLLTWPLAIGQWPTYLTYIPGLPTHLPPQPSGSRHIIFRI